MTKPSFEGLITLFERFGDDVILDSKAMVRIPSICNLAELEEALLKAEFIDLDGLLKRKNYYSFSISPNYWKNPPPFHSDEKAF